MSSSVNINILVEGQTEVVFVQKILAPYLAQQGIYMQVTENFKGSIMFSHAERSIIDNLKNRKDTYVTLLIDYYGIKKWVSYQESKKRKNHQEKVEYLENATLEKIKEVAGLKIDRLESRFIPYFSMYEFEALLFSDSAMLASEIGLADTKKVDEILQLVENPEQINSDNPPSHRIEKIAVGRFIKLVTGIALLENIKIPKIREKCPLFNRWLQKIEKLEPLS